MARVHSRDTSAEMIVRRLLFRMGYRYRVQIDRLPGKPDIVFPGRRKAIFVHGCFWHGHPGCTRAVRPTSNTGYWHNKLDRNIQRDNRTYAALAEAGWQTCVVWECELRNPDMPSRLRTFLGDPRFGGAS